MTRDALHARIAAAVLHGANRSPGVTADLILDLGDLESRWEVRGYDDDPDDRWYCYCGTQEEAERIVTKKGGEMFVTYTLRFAPISADGGEGG